MRQTVSETGWEFWEVRMTRDGFTYLQFRGRALRLSQSLDPDVWNRIYFHLPLPARDRKLNGVQFLSETRGVGVDFEGEDDEFECGADQVHVADDGDRQSGAQN